MSKKHLIYIQDEEINGRFQEEDKKSALVTALLGSYYQKDGKLDEEESSWADNLAWDSVLERVYNTETQEPVSVTPKKVEWLKKHGKVLR